MRIGVVADTHVGERAAGLPPAAAAALAGVDLILHAGDVCDAGALAELEAVAPVLAVRGNHDGDELAHLPRDLVVRIGSVRIGLTHGHRPHPAECAHAAATLVTGRLPLRGMLRAARRRFGDVDAVVLGHLHVPIHEWCRGALMFSPGGVYIARRDAARRWRPLERPLHGRLRDACPPGSDEPRVGLIEVRGPELRARSVALTG